MGEGGARNSARLWLRLGLVALVAALVVLSTVFGWAAANRLLADGVVYEQPEVVTVALPDYAPGVSTKMPDVRGLELLSAQQALVDAGVPASVIRSTNRAAAGPSGLVIQQSPVFGAANPNSVLLVVSAAAKVPGDILGRDGAQAVLELQALGAKVQQQRRYVPGKDPGTVASVSPKPGRSLPSVVKLVIADSPVTTRLDEYTKVEGGYNSSSTDFVHRGVTYDRAMTISTGWYTSSGVNHAWRLDRRAEVFQGRIARSESASGSATVVIRGDGKRLASYTITGSSPIRFSLRVGKVKTLRITVTARGDDSTSIVFLDPRLLGSYSAGSP